MSNRQPPDVLFVDQTGQLGGAELSLLDLAAHYPGRCRVVLLADGPFRERLNAAGVETHVIPLPDRVSGVGTSAGPWRALATVPATFGVVRKLARLARESDVVYANTQKAWVLGAVAARLARRPAVWHLRDILTAEHFSRVNRRVAILLANRLARLVIANSHATAQAFADAGGQAPTRVVYNGIDPEQFKPDPSRPPAPRAALRDAGITVPDSAPVLAVFGRLSAWKGQHVAVAALHHIPHAHLVIVGDALFGEDAYAAQLHEQASDPALAGRVHLAGFQSDIPALMRAVDLVLHTSTAPEPFGRVIVEAQLCGRPVIASDAGGASEIITDGQTGRLVTPDDPDELALTVNNLLADTRATQNLAKAGREDATIRFSLSALVRGVEDALTNLDHFSKPSPKTSERSAIEQPRSVRIKTPVNPSQ